jgi:hypothetical protein
MDFAERVRFCRTELEKTRRDFPAASTEVQAAENLYVRALNDATCGGSPAVTGSDLSLTDDSKIHVVFYCDKVNVTAVFYVGEDRVEKPKINTLRVLFLRLAACCSGVAHLQFPGS